jgi:hypothetical protein
MRIAVLGAGGPAGVNVCRALHAAGHDLIGYDLNPTHLIWCEPFCTDVRQQSPGPLEHAFWSTLDLVHSQAEPPLQELTASSLPTLMPTAEVIGHCQDKLQTAQAWVDDGLRRYPPFEIREPVPDHLHLAQATLGLPFWLRATRGAGARGATLVEDLRTAHHWIRYWETRGSDIDWVAEEYLPGRDYCWTSLWQHGRLIAAFARERLEWLYPHLAPSGRTGTPTVAVTVHDERVNSVGVAAVLTIDPSPNGIYAVDLREDTTGVPRPTEINAGRWPTTSPLYHELGVNLPDLHARLHNGEPVELLGHDIYPAGIHLLRHIDCGHVFATADQLHGTKVATAA